MATDATRLRSEVLNTQVITRDTGKRLGIVRELWVDIDRREVIALGLRDNRLALTGLPKYIYLDSICQIGDVILVENDDVLIDLEVETYNQVLNCEVITEVGEPLGRVRDFQLNLEDGRLETLIIASLGLPQIPERLLSTYELPIEEIVSSGPKRLIVFEGSEDRLTQLTVGVLENLGIGKPPWENDENNSYYPPTARPENQLGTGIPLRTPVDARPVIEESWSDDDWEEARPAPAAKARRAETIRYEESYGEEDDNWSAYEKEKAVSAEYENKPLETTASVDYEDVQGDMWDDDVENEPYTAPPVNFPEKQKQIDYQED